MLWATVSSWSCFGWLYRAFPSLTAKNIISLILVLTIWWCPCVVFSCVVGREYLLWPVHSLGKTLLAFACFILYSKAHLITSLYTWTFVNQLYFKKTGLFSRLGKERNTSERWGKRRASPCPEGFMNSLAAFPPLERIRSWWEKWIWEGVGND